jgi:hypothetical protein
VACRVVAGNQAPDHTTIARFRARHEDALAAVFTGSLRLCAQAGMLNVGLVAVDGTKMGAPAALAANRGRAHIEAEVAKMLAEAAATDAAEDALFGADARGASRRRRCGVPRRGGPGSSRPRRNWTPSRRPTVPRMRLRWASGRGKERVSGKRLRGRKPKPAPDKAGYKPPKANTTDPESRVMSTSNGFVQGY